MTTSPYDRLGGRGRTGGRTGGRNQPPPPMRGGRSRGATYAGTERRTQPAQEKPIDDAQRRMLEFYNANTTDEEFREVFGIYGKEDIEILRRYPEMLSMASPHWWDRLQTFDNEVESGRRTLRIQRQIDSYKELPIAPRAKPKAVRKPVDATEAPPADTWSTRLRDLTDPSAEGGDIYPTVLSTRGEEFRKELTEEGMGGRATRHLGLFDPLAESVARLSWGGPDKTWRDAGRDTSGFETLYDAVMSGTLPISQTGHFNQGVYGEGPLGDPFKLGAIQKKAVELISGHPYEKPLRHKVLSQEQYRILELEAAFDKRSLGMQVAADPFTWTGLGGGAAFVAKGLGKGVLSATRRIGLTELGQLTVGRFGSNAEVMGARADSPIGRVAGAPGIRLGTRFFNRSAELYNHAEGSVGRAILETRLLLADLVERGDRFVTVDLQKFRSLGDWDKVFGFRIKNGVATNLMENVPGKPSTGDVMENARLSVDFDLSKYSGEVQQELRESFPGLATRPTREMVEKEIADTAEEIMNDNAHVTFADRFRLAFRTLDDMEQFGAETDEMWDAANRNMDELVTEARTQGYDADALQQLKDDAFEYFKEELENRIYNAAQREIPTPKAIEEVLSAMPDNPQVVLTRQMEEMIFAMRALYADALQMLHEEGIPVKELGKLNDFFHFVARKTVPKEESSHLGMGGGGSASSFMKSRSIDPDTGFAKLMSDMVAEQGSRYQSPLETYATYMSNAYRAIAMKRIAKNLEPFARTKEVEDTLKAAKTATGKTATRQTKSITAVKNAILMKRTAGITRKMMREAFPSLANDIDQAFSFRDIKPEDTIEAVSEAMIRTTLIDWPKFRTEMRILIGRSPQMIEQSDAKAVIKNLGIKQEEQAAYTKDLYEAMVESIGSQKKEALKSLQAKMEALQPLGTAAKKETAEAVAARKLQLGAALPDEGFTAALPGKFFGVASEDLGRIHGVDKPQKFADELADIIRDEGLDRYAPVRFFTKFNDAVRWMKTTYDFGHVFIQGLPLLFRDPEAWGYSTGLAMRSFFDDGVRAAYVTKNNGFITRMIEHNGHLGSSEFTQTMAKGGWFAKFPHAMQDLPGPPVVGNVAGTGARFITRFSGRFQESFETFLDVARIETWKSLEGVAVRSGNPKALDELGDFVNKLTGVTSSRSLGIGATQRQIESALIMFSPRYTRATIALIGDMLRGGLRGKEARIAVGRLMAGQVALHSAAAMALGQEPNLTPGKGRFLKVEINGQWIGFGGKTNALLNLMVDLTKAARDEPEALLTKHIFSPESYDDSALLRRIRYQLPSVTAGFMDIMTGTDPIGKRLIDPEDVKDLSAWGKIIGTRFGAFWIDAMFDAYGSDGLKGMTTAFGAEILGQSTYPVQARERRDAKREELAQQHYSQSIDEIDEDVHRGAKRARIDTDPEMVELIKAADEEQRAFKRNEERFEIDDRRTENDDEFVHTLRKAANEWTSHGNQAGKFLRNAYAMALTRRREGNKQLREDHPKFFEGIGEYYRELADRNPTAAYTAEFMDRAYTDENFDALGRPNYAKFDAIRRDLDVKYGKEAGQASDENSRRTLEELGMPHDILRLMESWETLRPYWDTYKEVVPEEFHPLWETFESAPQTLKTTLRNSDKYDFPKWESEIRRKRRRLQYDDLEIDTALFVFYDQKPIDRDLGRIWLERGR